MASKIHIIDNTTGQLAISRPEVPTEQAQPTPIVETDSKPTVALSASSQRKLDRRRVRRAVKEAKGIGHHIYDLLDKDTRKRLDDLIAILVSARADKKATRAINRALTDGLIAAGKEDR